MSRRRQAGTQLPRFLKPLFWSYEFRDLTWEADRDLVIYQILAVGDWQSIQWLRQQVTPAELRDWIIERRGRGLDPSRLRFWELILDLPHRRVSRWMSAMSTNPWFRRWGQT